MPRKTRQLQWHRASSQWCKRFKDKVHYLGKGTPKDNGMSGRLDEMYDAAFTRWESIKAEYDAADASVQRERKLKFLKEDLRRSELPRWAVVREQIERLDDGQGLEQCEVENVALAHVRLLAHRATSVEDWEEVAVAVTEIAKAGPKQCDENSVGRLVESFLEQKRLQEAAGQRSAGRYANLRYVLHQFRDWIGGDTPVISICSATVSAYYKHILNRLSDPNDKIQSNYTARCYFQVAKQFIRWLCENEYLQTRPANLDSKQLVIEVDEPKPKYLSPEQFQRLLDESSERSKLFWFLMANTGMTQVDIAALRPDDIDYEQEILVYKRSKMSRQSTRKPRTYRLWPETLTLLRKHAEATGAYVFTNANGKALVRRTVEENGEHLNINNITSAWNRVQHRAGLSEFSPGCIRKTGATILRNSPYASTVGIYLQHRASSTDDHYAADYDNTLDGALAYLRQMLLGDSTARAAGVE